MKKIIATSQNFSPLGYLQSVTFYYDNGTKSTKKLSEIKKTERFSSVRYLIGEFHPYPNQ